MERGKLIVIEGLDGSGKTTQIKNINSILSKNNVKYDITRECTNGPIGNLLRSVYLKGLGKCDEKIINMLMAADRLEHITHKERGLLTKLNKGINVISDRFYLSSLAYNVYEYVDTDMYDEAFEFTLNLNKYNMNLIKPDLTIFLDISPKASIERIGKNRDEVTVYESIEKLTKINTAYKKAISHLVLNNDERIDIINAELNEYVITNSIIEKINSII